MLTAILIFVKAHKKVLSIIVSCILGLLILAWALTSASSCYDRYQINRAEKNLNVAKQEEANIKETISNLEIKQVEANANANAAIKDLEEKRTEVNAAQEDTNKALDNVNKVRNQDFNGTGMDEANRARCAAFPTSPECVR